jgi:hypothetical protein
LWRMRVDFVESAKTRTIGQRQIEQHQINHILIKKRNRIREPLGAMDDLKRRLFRVGEDFLQKPRIARVVLDEQDSKVFRCFVHELFFSVRRLIARRRLDDAGSPWREPREAIPA